MPSTLDQPAARPPQARRVTPQPTLVVIDAGPLHGQRFTLNDDQTVVGRREHSDVVLPEAHVSRIHAVIRKHDDTVWIEDLGSTSGTWVNRQPVTGARALRHRDQIHFGAVLTRLENPTATTGREEPTEMIGVLADQPRPLLSPRQHEVLACLRDGWSNPEIADHLGITERTVKAHCQELFDRLGADNRTSAVVAALQGNLLEPADNAP